MWSSLIVFGFAALATGAAAFWALRAYSAEGGRRARSSMIICVFGAIVSLGIYLVIGHPEIPGAPFAARLEALKLRDPRSYTADEALAVLEGAARENPRDALPYLYSGQMLLNQGRALEAQAAFNAALRREPNSVEALLGLGRSKVQLEGGRVTPEALALFQRATPLTQDAAPILYQAMAAMQANDNAAARRLWAQAYARMSEDDPRREMARQMSQTAGREE